MGRDGWQITRVAALLDMGRRAIQRSCGKNASSGDLGIVSVDGSVPGRRLYGADELAQLHLVNCLNEDGMDLVSVGNAFEEARASGGLARLAQGRRELDVERAEAAAARLLRDRALAARDDAEELGRLIEREVAAELVRHGAEGPFPAGWLVPGLESAAHGNAPTVPRRDGLLAALENPGLDLAIELLLGPGSYERVLNALEDLKG